MGVKRYIVEQRTQGSFELKRVFKHTEKGKLKAFHLRNKLRRQSKAVRVREASMSRTGKVVKRWKVGTGAPILSYPFEGGKDHPSRRKVYDKMTLGFGARHTSGDRLTKHTAGGLVSDHYIGAPGSWADDYGWNWWTVLGKKLQAKAHEWLLDNIRRLPLKQVYAEPHGTGPHIHVAGWR